MAPTWSDKRVIARSCAHVFRIAEIMRSSLQQRVNGFCSQSSLLAAINFIEDGDHLLQLMIPTIKELQVIDLLGLTICPQANSVCNKMALYMMLYLVLVDPPLAWLLSVVVSG
ncbi:unnamed protein product [Ilex paraguariensis]|uniref:Uncharacterized protein n=1 Tax=Ilex paraguariensis TaxID=185542 RepID=A0ABC8SQ00_9AQUA